jgi:DNA-binding CsgD family transcriptional regulator
MSRTESVVVGAPVPSLVALGVSPDADLVYRTLITFGPSAAADLARGLGLPRRRVVDALDELAGRAAVTSRSARRGEQPTWAARSPAEVVPALRRWRLRATAPPPALPLPLPPEVSDFRFGDGLRHLRSREAARARMARLVTVVAREELIMNTERTFDPEAARAAAPMDFKVLARGVRMRVLGLHPVEMDPLIPYGRRQADKRPEYRQARAVPMKLIVVDRRVALFPVVPGDLTRGYLEVAQPPLVEALVAMFERHWHATTPPPATATAVHLSQREHALVALLADGHTDATAARRLRISPRSVTNVVRGLMDRLGVENRFQLGLALGAAVQTPGTPATTTHGEEE